MRRHDTLLYPRIAWWYACGLWGLIRTPRRAVAVVVTNHEQRRVDAWLTRIRINEGQ